MSRSMEPGHDEPRTSKSFGWHPPEAPGVDVPDKARAGRLTPTRWIATPSAWAVEALDAAESKATGHDGRLSPCWIG